MIGTKACSKCGNVFSRTREHFYCDKNTKDGFLSRCKSCKDESDRAYREKNKEKIYIRQKKYKEKNLKKLCECNKAWRDMHKDELTLKKKKYYDENREKILEQKKVYGENNKEKIKIKNKIYGTNNKESIREQQKTRYYAEKQTILKQKRVYYQREKQKILINRKKYRQANGKKIHILNNRYRSRLALLDNTLTEQEWEQCQQYFNNVCCYCGKQKRLTIDHFIPVSKQGETSVENVLPSCQTCNSSKSSRDFADWFCEESFYLVGREKKILKYLNYKGNKQQLALF